MSIHLALSDKASVMAVKVLIATLNLDSSRLVEYEEGSLPSLHAPLLCSILNTVVTIHLFSVKFQEQC